MTLEVANEIMRQLGGVKFTVMTGAKHYMGGKDFISFQLPTVKNKKGQKINGFRITLDASDTYTLEALYFSGIRSYLTTVDKRFDVYNDMLQEIFTDMTGLDTHL